MQNLLEITVKHPSNDGVWGRFSRILDAPPFLYFFAIAVVGITFKQLRGFHDVGVMEIATLLAALITLLARTRDRRDATMLPLTGATALFILLMLGGIWALFTDPARLSVREAAAYCFTFLIIVAFILNFADKSGLAFQVFGRVIGVYLLAVSLLAFVPNPLQQMMWYEGVRLQGLSINPNQIAFIAITGLSFLATDEILGHRPDRVSLISSLACGIGGAFSESSAFTFALFVGAAIIFIHAIYLRFFYSAPIDQKARSVAEIVPKSIAIAVVVSCFHLGYPHIANSLKFPTWTPAAQSGASAQSGNSCANKDRGGKAVIATAESELCNILHSDNDQGGIRFRMWADALDLAKHSPIVGYGPGLHIRVPVVGSTALQEAHNTVLDILVISGLIGLSGLFGVMCWSLYSSISNKRLYLFLILGSPMLVFMSFHYVGRQPLFWILLFCAWQVTARPKNFTRTDSAI
jgi:hypothetical protein